MGNIDHSDLVRKVLDESFGENEFSLKESIPTIVREDFSYFIKL